MIHIRYVAHSSVLVRCGETSLVFDPWLSGPAYDHQWFLWPLPVDRAEELEVDAILISHGHEDHLHPATLKAMKKTAAVFFPFQWRAGIQQFLNRFGFTDIREAVSFKTYRVNDVRVTYISFSLESVVVIEYRGEVLVNINDALNSNHENAVEFILKELSARWPRIDYLLSGWSGASYFPNQVRYPGKNDEETGQLREQYFANNFCRFITLLRPRYAVPFAPGFVLLYKENQWINHIKFPRAKLEAYYREHFDAQTSTRFFAPYPGDTLAGGALTTVSPLHQVSEQQQYEQVYRHYAKEIEAVNSEPPVAKPELDRLPALLLYWMEINKQLYHAKVVEDLAFSIRLRDCPAPTFINVRYRKGQPDLQLAEAPLEKKSVLITTSAARLLLGLKKEWGGDLLTIGYGLKVEVYDQLSLEKNLDIVCIRLVTRYPITRKDLVKYPLRALRFYTYNPRLTSLWIRQKIVLKPYVNKYPYNERDHWLSYKKCDLCAVCKMPEINLQAYY